MIDFQNKFWVLLFTFRVAWPAVKVSKYFYQKKNKEKSQSLTPMKCIFILYCFLTHHKALPSCVAASGWEEV